MAWAARLVVIATAVLLGSAALAPGAVRRDRTPPVFAGLKTATTCIPGPVDSGRKSSYRLTWAPAKDNRTPAARIRYDIYQAIERGGERFSAPTYTSAPGATVFVTPTLWSSSGVYFVVRARDAAGNRDRNRRELPGTNLCL
jgi:hypothetical protein